MRKNLPATVAQKIINDYLASETIGGEHKLPTQKELQARYYVSRTTVLKAIDILRKDKLIYSIQGKGMFFTNDRLSLYLNGIYSYDYQLMKSGIMLQNKLLSSRVCEASDEVADKLGIKSGEKVIEIIRKKVDSKSGEDLILQCNYLSYDRFREIDFNKLNNNRLYSVLGTDFDLNLTSADEQIMLSYIDNKYRKFISGKFGDVMRIDRTSYEQQVIVEYTHTYLLSNSFKYDVKLNLTNPLF